MASLLAFATNLSLCHPSDPAIRMNRMPGMNDSALRLCIEYTLEKSGCVRTIVSERGVSKIFLTAWPETNRGQKLRMALLTHRLSGGLSDLGSVLLWKGGHVEKGCWIAHSCFPEQPRPWLRNSLWGTPELTVGTEPGVSSAEV